MFAPLLLISATERTLAHLKKRVKYFLRLTSVFSVANLRRMKTKKLDAGFAAAIEAAGSRTELARRLGITPGAISQWKRIPIERVPDVEAVTGVKRSVLRPDFWLPRGR